MIFRSLRKCPALLFAMFLVLSCQFFAFPMAHSAEELSPAALGEAYLSEIQPLLERYCYDCHGSADASEGEINLASMTSWDEATNQPKTWQRVAEMLENSLMPPEDAEQPNDAERSRLRQWVGDYLKLAARAQAGDPGRVVLRRLNNAEYTNTLRDLTGVESLDPAREFPADGAAGEGFTNTGGALSMSPELVAKYLDAAKKIASHAVLLPDGFRFSPHTTARDWTDDTLAEIRKFYREFADTTGGSQVNLQGVVFETNQGGRLPLEEYLAATLTERESLSVGDKTINAVALEHGLNAKYLGILWSRLTNAEPSLLLDDLRKRWRKAEPADAGILAADIAAWQTAMWNFSTVGLIGRKGGPRRWMEPVDMLETSEQIRFKIPESPAGQDITISLVASDAGDGNEHDFVVWQSPRLVAPGRPDLLLRDVRAAAVELASRRTRMFTNTAAYLNAADDVTATTGVIDLDAIAMKHGINTVELRAWLNYLGIGAGEAVALEGHFTNKLSSVGGHEFLNGWGDKDPPFLLVNSSDEFLNIPGHVKARDVVVHPTPTLRVGAAWRSPLETLVSIDAEVVLAHPECSNGATWILELRSGTTRKQLASGIVSGGKVGKAGPLTGVRVRAGDTISLLVGSWGGFYECDLTAINLIVTDQSDGGQQTWNLADDLFENVLEENPHSDQFGNPGVWHFYAEPDVDATGPVIPADSLAAKWQSATSGESREKLARQLQDLLVNGSPESPDSPDAALYKQITPLTGPLIGAMSYRATADIPAVKNNGLTGTDAVQASEAGPDPDIFGRHPQGGAIDAANLCVHAPSVVEIRLPAELTVGCELVTTAKLDQKSGTEGSVQVKVVAGKPAQVSGLRRGEVKVTAEIGQSWASNIKLANTAPILVTDKSSTQRRLQAEFDEYRQLFPPALCYSKIIPVDEALAVTLYYREDDYLIRLMLDESQREQLDRLWDELHFVSRDALTSVDAFSQLMEFATQDANPEAFEVMRQPILDRAAAFRQELIDCEPIQINALVDFAASAYRRPLTAEEAAQLHTLYESLRNEKLTHEEAFRLTLARVLVAPAFLYRIEKPGAGDEQGPVSDWELANRLSYFLWASQPDKELREAAAGGRLQEVDELVAQTNRMLTNAKTRQLATEFACQWLHVDDFEHLDEKSERHFPTFAGLRGAMAEETILFFTDLFQHGGSVLDILDADYTFLNEELAQHYDIPGVKGDHWRRVDGVKQHSRGGILAQASTLAKHSGASRTSPILRGTWISEALLGDRLPKPPPGIPPLPEEGAATDELTVRELVERHVSDPKCVVCHQRIDPYGFSLEAFDTIGGHREKDIHDRPIDAHVTTMDGAEFEGLEGLRNYLLTKKRDVFVRQFCRKLLGYALARAVQLSDEPLLAEIQSALAANDYNVQIAVETIVRSQQFREIRGIEMALKP